MIAKKESMRLLANLQEEYDLYFIINLIIDKILTVYYCESKSGDFLYLRECEVVFDKDKRAVFDLDKGPEKKFKIMFHEDYLFYDVFCARLIDKDGFRFFPSIFWVRKDFCLPIDSSRKEDEKVSDDTKISQNELNSRSIQTYIKIIERLLACKDMEELEICRDEIFNARNNGSAKSDIFDLSAKTLYKAVTQHLYKK